MGSDNCRAMWRISWNLETCLDASCDKIVTGRWAGLFKAGCFALRNWEEPNTEFRAPMSQFCFPFTCPARLQLQAVLDVFATCSHTSAACVTGAQPCSQPHAVHFLLLISSSIFPVYLSTYLSGFNLLRHHTTRREYKYVISTWFK